MGVISLLLCKLVLELLNLTITSECFLIKHAVLDSLYVQLHIALFAIILSSIYQININQDIE